MDSEAEASARQVVSQVVPSVGEELQPVAYFLQRRRVVGVADVGAEECVSGDDVVGAVAVPSQPVFDPAGQTPPSQCDYDGGSLPPTGREQFVATVQAAALIATLPVSVLALYTAAASLRLWKEQVSAIIATGVASLAALVSIGLDWIGISALIFFN